MAESRRRKRGRQAAPSKTTTPIAVRVPNDLLVDVRRIARAEQRGPQCVYYPDETAAALKPFILEALSALVEARIKQNRWFFDGLDLRDRDRERGLGLCVDRRTELDPPYARREVVVARAEMILVRSWPRRRVHQLEDVPQGSGKVPTDPPRWFKVPRVAGTR